MINFRDDILAPVLAGGLPNLVDYGAGATPNGATAGDTQPEKSPPEPTNQDVEPFLLNVSRGQILTVTAIAVGALGLLYVIKKL